MSNYKVSARYAKALYEASMEVNASMDVYKDTELIIRSLNISKELGNLISSPIIPALKKQAVFEEIFKPNIHAITYAFLTLCINKGRENILYDICKSYISLYNEKNNRVSVDIFIANEVSEQLKSNLEERLSKWLDKTILPNYIIDKDLKAGIKVQWNDLVYDATIKSQLNLLKQNLLANNSIINN